jgi:uncharacterized protein YecE (DUF72 family)
MRKVLIGTSGWGYDEWVGPFYPKGLKKEGYLSYYSKVYYTNEINTTFYNIPNKWVVDNWVKKTPENFVFTAKIPQTITHKSKLDCDECLNDLDIFLDAMSPLISAKKLKAFLIQLPPSFKKPDHFGNLKEFIASWPSDWEKEGYFLVIEFRHKSWMEEEVFNYLKAKSLSYCAVIEPLLPSRMDVTNPEFAYVRFHGYGKKIWFDYYFKEEEIKKWAISVKEVIEKSKQVGIYFNNHFSGYAAKNALMMMKELDLRPRTDPSQISLLDVKKESGEISKGQTSLDNFF